MTFFVDPAAVAKLGDLTVRAADDARTMYAHVDRYVHLKATGEGLINLFRSGDDHNEALVRAFLDRLARGSLGGTACAINAALANYRVTDTRTAARFDAGLTRLDATATIDYDDVAGYRTYPGLFQDAVEPTRNLTAPPDYNGELPPEPSWMELVTPAGFVRQTVIEATTLLAAIGVCDRPYDLYELALKPLCGDWAGMATIGHVLAQTAAALGDLYQNLWWAGQSVDNAWRGNAADAVTVHLNRLSSAVNQGSNVFDAMSAEYYQAAHAAYEIRQVVGVLLNDILDTAAKILLKSALGAGAAATGFGLPLTMIGVLWTMSDAYKLVKDIGSLLDTIHRIVVAAGAFNSRAGEFGLISEFDIPTLPAAPVLVR